MMCYSSLFGVQIASVVREKRQAVCELGVPLRPVYSYCCLERKVTVHEESKDHLDRRKRRNAADGLHEPAGNGSPVRMDGGTVCGPGYGGAAKRSMAEKAGRYPGGRAGDRKNGRTRRCSCTRNDRRPSRVGVEGNGATGNRTAAAADGHGDGQQ